MQKQSWLHPSLILAASKIHGKGIFSKENLGIGTTVIKWGGEIIGKRDIDAGKAVPHTAVAIGENLWLAATDADAVSVDDYMNHSCDPTCWMLDETTIITRKPIIALETELSADYAVWLNTPEYKMKSPCGCGAVNCRQFITGQDWLLPQVIEAQRGHFSPFLNRRIEAKGL